VKILKIYREGLKFDSKLEEYMYDLLDESGLDFKFQKKYVLQPSFKYRSESIRPMTLTVDFEVYVSELIVIDTKGFQREDNKLKWKLFKKMLKDKGDPPEIFLPRSRAACRQLVKYLQTKK
jgi:hypothetical protein